MKVVMFQIFQSQHGWLTVCYCVILSDDPKVELAQFEEVLQHYKLHRGRICWTGCFRLF